MPAIIIYLIKLTCSLSITWLFYRLVLRSLTFYTWNRWYLLGYTLISFLIPFIDIGPIRGEDPTLQPLIVQYIPVIDKPLPPTIAPVAGPHATHWDTWSILLLLLALGSCFLLLRFLNRCYSLRNLRRRAVLWQEGPISIYRIPEPISPFSFGNAIYINTDQHSEKEWEEIILHEYVHIRQRHTLDIFLGELLIIVNWYNPFAWLIRFSIRQNLEFIADRAVIDNGFDKKGYQYHLLRVVGQTRYKLANNFNFSSLKKRIVMMNKLRSARLHLIRFMFILPLLCVLLVAFRNRFPAFHSGKVRFINVAGIVLSMPSRQPMAGVTVREVGTGIQAITDHRGYYKFSIPVRGDSARISIYHTKAGYDGGRTDRYWPSLKQSAGICDIGFMRSQADSSADLYSAGPMGETPEDPSYGDVVRKLKNVVIMDMGPKMVSSLQQLHPEIGLLYITTDRQHCILVRSNGIVDRYGYPGTHAISDMDDAAKQLRYFMAAGMPPANRDDLSRWAAISAQAEKDFHTTNPTAKAVIFPGDSRVIAIPVSGKAKVYDMDNDDPREAPAFEALYGPLPACVPTPHHYPSSTMRLPRPTDTVPRKPDTTGANGVFYITTKKAPKRINPAMFTAPPKQRPTVYIVDGNWVDYNALDSLGAGNIRTVTIPTPGVVLIHTKKAIWPHVVLETKDADGKPMKVIADSLHTPEGDIHAENNVPDTEHP